MKKIISLILLFLVIAPYTYGLAPRTIMYSPFRTHLFSQSSTPIAPTIVEKLQTPEDIDRNSFLLKLDKIIDQLLLIKKYKLIGNLEKRNKLIKEALFKISWRVSEMPLPYKYGKEQIKISDSVFTQQDWRTLENLSNSLVKLEEEFLDDFITEIDSDLNTLEEIALSIKNKINTNDYTHSNNDTSIKLQNIYKFVMKDLDKTLLLKMKEVLALELCDGEEDIETILDDKNNVWAILRVLEVLGECSSNISFETRKLDLVIPWHPVNIPEKGDLYLMTKVRSTIEHRRMKIEHLLNLQEHKYFLKDIIQNAMPIIKKRVYILLQLSESLEEDNTVELQKEQVLISYKNLNNLLTTAIEISEQNQQEILDSMTIKDSHFDFMTTLGRKRRGLKTSIKDYYSLRFLDDFDVSGFKEKIRAFFQRNSEEISEQDVEEIKKDFNKIPFLSEVYLEILNIFVDVFVLPISLDYTISGNENKNTFKRFFHRLFNQYNSNEQLSEEEKITYEKFLMIIEEFLNEEIESEPIQLLDNVIQRIKESFKFKNKKLKIIKIFVYKQFFYLSNIVQRQKLLEKILENILESIEDKSAKEILEEFLQNEDIDILRNRSNEKILSRSDFNKYFTNINVNEDQFILLLEKINNWTLMKEDIDEFLKNNSNFEGNPKNLRKMKRKIKNRNTGFVQYTKNKKLEKIIRKLYVQSGKSDLATGVCKSLDGISIGVTDLMLDEEEVDDYKSLSTDKFASISLNYLEELFLELSQSGLNETRKRTLKIAAQYLIEDIGLKAEALFQDENFLSLIDKGLSARNLFLLGFARKAIAHYPLELRRHFLEYYIDQLVLDIGPNLEKKFQKITTVQSGQKLSFRKFRNISLEEIERKQDILSTYILELGFKSDFRIFYPEFFGDIGVLGDLNIFVEFNFDANEEERNNFKLIELENVLCQEFNANVRVYTENSYREMFRNKVTEEHLDQIFLLSKTIDELKAISSNLQFFYENRWISIETVDQQRFLQSDYQEMEDYEKILEFIFGDLSLITRDDIEKIIINPKYIIDKIEEQLLLYNQNIDQNSKRLADFINLFRDRCIMPLIGPYRPVKLPKINQNGEIEYEFSPIKVYDGDQIRDPLEYPAFLYNKNIINRNSYKKIHSGVNTRNFLYIGKFIDENFPAAFPSSYDDQFSQKSNYLLNLHFNLFERSGQELQIRELTADPFEVRKHNLEGVFLENEGGDRDDQEPVFNSNLFELKFLKQGTLLNNPNNIFSIKKVWELNNVLYDMIQPDLLLYTRLMHLYRISGLGIVLYEEDDGSIIIHTQGFYVRLTKEEFDLLYIKREEGEYQKFDMVFARKLGEINQEKKIGYTREFAEYIHRILFYNFDKLNQIKLTRQQFALSQKTQYFYTEKELIEEREWFHERRSEELKIKNINQIIHRKAEKFVIELLGKFRDENPYLLKYLLEQIRLDKMIDALIDNYYLENEFEITRYDQILDEDQKIAVLAMVQKNKMKRPIKSRLHFREMVKSDISFLSLIKDESIRKEIIKLIEKKKKFLVPLTRIEFLMRKQNIFQVFPLIFINILNRDIVTEFLKENSDKNTLINLVLDDFKRIFLDSSLSDFGIRFNGKYFKKMSFYKEVISEYECLLSDVVLDEEYELLIDSDVKFIDIININDRNQSFFDEYKFIERIFNEKSLLIIDRAGELSLETKQPTIAPFLTVTSIFDMFKENVQSFQLAQSSNNKFLVMLPVRTVSNFDELIAESRSQDPVLLPIWEKNKEEWESEETFLKDRKVWEEYMSDATIIEKLKEISTYKRGLSKIIEKLDKNILSSRHSFILKERKKEYLEKYYIALKKQHKLVFDRINSQYVQSKIYKLLKMRNCEEENLQEDRFIISKLIYLDLFKNVNINSSLFEQEELFLSNINENENPIDIAMKIYLLTQRSA